MREESPTGGRKAEIIEAALALFLERGYTHTRIDDIIERVGIAKGTFYHHFQSKGDVLEAVIRFLISHFSEIIEGIARSDLSAGEKLGRMWSALGNIGGSSRVIEELLEDDESIAFVLRLIRQGMESTSELHLEVIEQGIREGSVRTPFPAMAAKTFAALDILVFSACSEEERLALGRFAEMILETDRPYLTGIAGFNENEERA